MAVLEPIVCTVHDNSLVQKNENLSLECLLQGLHGLCVVAHFEEHETLVRIRIFLGGMEHMLAQHIRPKFKAGIYAIPLPDGVYLRGNNNHLMLKGRSLYLLLEHLIPHLDGNTTLEELTGELGAEKKSMLVKLLEKLFAHQFLIDINQNQPYTLLPEEVEVYASNIAFIESFQTSAAHRFACFRNKRFLIIGSESGFTSLVQASLQCGVRQIDVIITPEDERDARSCQDILDACVRSDSAQTVQLVHAPSWENEADVRNTIQTYDAVLSISERSMLARTQLFNRLCIEQQKIFIQAMIVGEHAWIGPLVCPEIEGCWECAWRRWQINMADRSAQLSHDEFYDQPQASSSQLLTTSKMTQLANRLIFALFKYFTHTGSPETVGHVCVLDLETDLSETHTFLPHPHCLACQYPVVPTAEQFLERIQQLQHLDPIDPDTFLVRFADCAVDARFGIFTMLGNDHFVQMPLAVYEVKQSNPTFRQDQPETLTTVAASIDTRDARLGVSQKACAMYAANLVDRRRLLSSETARQQSYPLLSADQLIGLQAPSSQDEMWTWALDLQTQHVCVVPATCVFAALHNQDRGPASERGIATGMSWDEAICQALLDWCNYLTVECLKDARQAYLQVDLAKTPLTAEGMHLSHLLETGVRQTITVYDVTGPLRVPTFATCCDEKIVAYSTHCDGAQALRMGLERVLQKYQAEQCLQPAYAVASVPDFPATLRSNQLSVPCYTLPDTWPARQEWLLQSLQANGLRAFAVPLDHDPALAQVLPFTVRVLLSRAESRKEK